MTMVAVCRFKDGAVVVADSRATWQGSSRTFQDTLQKILPLGNKTSISFAGDVLAASVIVNQLRQLIRKKPRLLNLRKLAAEIPRIARHYYGRNRSKTARSGPLSLVLAGTDSSGKVGVWCYESPHFNSRHLKTGFEVVGSGAVVKSYIGTSWKHLEEELLDLKSRADKLMAGLEGTLKEQRIETVGGLFQTIIIDSSGIRPLRHGFITLDPEGFNAAAKSMEMKAGRWIQRDEITGRDVPLVEPLKLITGNPEEMRFHDFEPRLNESEVPKWHLTYLLTCLAVKKDIGTIEFNGIGTCFAAPKYPASLPLISAVGFWGSAGTHELEFKLVHGGKPQSIYTEEIHVEFLTEEVDLAIPITLDVPEPGPYFLECYISGQLLGRRAIYFGQFSDSPASETKLIEISKKLRQKLLEQHRACRDTVLEDSGRSELVYFSVCQNCITEGGYLKFERQFVAAYWRSYPLKLRLFIASGFRMPSGEHDVRLDLVNASTREVSTIGNMTVTSNSSCNMIPIHGELIPVVPKAGLYFVNVHIDNQLVGSVILAAETDRPLYSYNLEKENLTSVTNGELLILLKRAQIRSSKTTLTSA